MEEKYTLNTALAALAGLGCLTAVLCGAFLPAAVLPTPDLPLLCALSLLALVAECYLTKRVVKRAWAVTIVLGGLTFGLLPLCAGLVPAGEALRLGFAGGAAFAVLTFLFTSLRERLASGAAGRLSPVIAGGVLFLACQSLAGLVL